MDNRNMIITTILFCPKDHARLLRTKYTLKKEKHMVHITFQEASYGPVLNDRVYLFVQALFFFRYLNQLDND